MMTQKMNKLANKVSFKCNFLICPIPACLYPSEQIPILSLFGEDTKLYSNSIYAASVLDMEKELLTLSKTDNF